MSDLGKRIGCPGTGHFDCLPIGEEKLSARCIEPVECVGWSEGGRRMKKTFARTLRTLRLRYRMSQEELAEHLFVTKAAISNWETQRYMPTAYTLKRISKVLKVTIDELLLGPAEGVYYQPLTLQEQMMLRHFRWMCEERKAAVLTLIQE